ncbi:MAG: OPT/YSL family transporter [Candidatus Bathyarchaeia archaeon]
MIGEVEYKKIQSGLTHRSLLFLTYAIFLFMPALLWTELATGVQFLIGWMVFFIFAEVASLSGKSITTAEGALVMRLSGMLKAQYAIFTALIFRRYFMESDLAIRFNILSSIPDWWVAKAPEITYIRTFVHPEWLIPILIALSLSFLTLLSDIALGLFVAQVYIYGEKLPFPVERMTADGIEAIVERSKEKINLLTLGMEIGILYALIIYGGPIISEILNIPALAAAPIPWFDFNFFLHSFLPGASFGISTSLPVILQGLIVPFNIILCIFIGSFALYFIGNSVLVAYGWSPFAKEFFSGMSISLSLQRSWMYVWMGPFIGVSLAATIIPLIHHREYLIGAFRSLAHIKSTEADIFSLWFLMGLWLGSALISVILVYILVPSYPLWMMFLLSLGWSFMWSLLSARAVGETGASLEPPALVPFFKALYVSLSDYKGLDIWFIDPVISTGAVTICSSLKVCQLSGCSFKSFIKAYILLWPIAILLGLFYSSIFWSVAPIPSSAYPATEVYWPLSAINQVMWMTGRAFTAFEPAHIIGAFTLTSSIYIIAQIFHLPISTIGLAVGMSTALPVATSMLFGGILNKILYLIFRERWKNSRTVIVAGALLGNTLVLSVLSALIMVAKSISVEPY